MSHLQHHTTHSVQCARFFPVALLLFLLIGSSNQLSAQGTNPWTFDTIRATVGFGLPSSFNPQISIDRWGVRHHTWVTRDPNSAGLQVYHSNNATGRLGSPFLLSDTGTIYDSLSIDTVSYLTLPDREGFLHTLFLANVPESNGLEIGLYYTHNRQSHVDSTDPVRLTTSSGRYALAVDSAGVAHAIWLIGRPEGLEVRYWNSQVGFGNDRAIDTIPSGPMLPIVPSPTLDLRGENLHYFVRNDTGAVYYGVDLNDGSVATTRRLPISVGSGLLPLPDRDPADFQLRSALDQDGAWHLLVPLRDESDSLIRLRYASNASGSDQVETLVELDSALYGFDMRGTGEGTIGVAWTKFRGRFRAEIPTSGYLELRRASPGVWTREERVDDLDAEVGNVDREWRAVNRLDLRDGRVVIALYRYRSKDELNPRGVGYYARRPLLPEIRSIFPDGAGPGMSLVVEFAAPYNNVGAFGPDGIRSGDLTVELVNPADNARLVIGPTIVSWDGRLVSATFFVLPGATTGPVPVRLLVDGVPTNTLAFQILEPQRLGPAGDGRLSGDGILGSGGEYGVRTPGGLLLVDTLILSDGIFRVVSNDPDLLSPGAEGAMPVSILARGAVVIDSTATLVVSAPPPFLPENYGDAGPGGGGGGAGLEAGGGIGFTGGGPPGRSLEKGTPYQAPGSGSEVSAGMSGGGSRLGTPGGAGRPGMPGGGGTGHPFGVSGRYGQEAPLHPLRRDEGGVGGGSGGDLLENGVTTGGGGGGHGDRGENGGLLAQNGGHPAGSPVLVPMSGGSGGGGAISDRGNAAGGGGGGGLQIYAERSLSLFGRIEAEGAEGTSGQIDLNSSGGGGGSGGGVMIGAQGGIVLGSRGGISIAGGRGGAEAGPDGRPGGDGSRGRVRVDGRVDKFDELAQFDSLSAEYFALATDMSGSFQVDDSVEITGTGTAGRTIRVYAWRGSSSWSQSAPLETTVDTAGHWKVRVGPTGTGPLYVGSMERVDESEGIFEDGSPSWIMSTAGGLLVGTPDASINVDSIDYGCVDFGACRNDSVVIRNTGTQSDLFVRNPEVIGGAGWFIIGEFSPIRIPPGATGVIPLRFCPGDTGTADGVLQFRTNLPGDTLQSIPLKGCGRAGELRVLPPTIDLGPLCPDDCRDTVVTLKNIGNAPLSVTRLTPGDGTLSAEILSPPVPITLAPDESRDVRVRICLRGATGLYSASFQATTPFPAQSIAITMENLGPDFTLPDEASLLERDLGVTDTCPVVRFTLKNLREDAAMSIERLLPRSPFFQLISPAAGTSLAPLESVEVALRFCGDTVGDYFDTLDLRLESGPCGVDTLVLLRGRVLNSVPDLSLSVDQKLDLGTLPVGRESGPGTVRVVNSGVGTARDLTYRLEAIGTTNLSEFSVTTQSGPPFDVRGNESVSIAITATPAVVGVRSIRLILQTSSGDWIDTVEVCVNGVEPGVVADRYLVAFDPVRKSDRTTATLRFYNEGTSPDDIIEFALDDSTRFAIIGQQSTSGGTDVPHTLRPDLDSVELTLEFMTADPGPFVDTLRATTSGGEEIVVQLSGLSALERGVLEPASLTFDCGEMQVRRITVRNEGTWDLLVDQLFLDGVDRDLFRLLDQPAPDRLAPGATATYRVEYLGSEAPAQAFLIVSQSGPERLSARLIGEGCAPEATEITLEIPDLTGLLEDEIEIPLILTTERPLPQEIDLEFLLRFDGRSLMPVGRNPVADVVTLDGSGDEMVPGELSVMATIPAGTQSGTLLTLSTRVLLGAHYRTLLEIEVVPTSIPARYRLTVDNGSFTALDCDTTGGVDLSGTFNIKQSRPNPTNGTVAIPFTIARSQRVEIRLFAVDGALVETLLDQVLEKGEHTVTFTVADLPAGIYTYEIVSGRYRESGRLVVRE